MKRKEIEAMLSEWKDAWKRRDAVALKSLFIEDAVYDSTLAGNIQGHPAIEALYRSWFAAFPEVEFEFETPLVDRSRVALFWSQRGRHMGDFCGLPGTGRSFVIHGVFQMTIEDRRITSMRSLYDFTGLLVQIGVLKAKPAT